MLKTLPEIKVAVTDVKGEVPDIETLVKHGSVVNLKDMKLFFIREEGKIEELDIDVDTLKSILSVTATVKGRLTYSPAKAFPGTILRMDEIGTIVSAGDKLRLPYGDVVNVLFTTRDNGVVIDRVYPSNTINEAEVSRVAAPVSELTNPSELSKLWDSFTEIIQSPVEPEPEAPAGTNHKVVTSPAWYDPETKVINPGVVIPEGEVIN